MNRVLTKFNFKPSLSAPCIDCKGEGGSKIIIAPYVGDVFVINKSKKRKYSLRSQLSTEYMIKHLGVAKSILGTRISCKHSKVYLDQGSCIEQQLGRFVTNYCAPTLAHSPVGKKLIKSDTYDNHPYQHLVGSLNYLAVCTRPDIAFSSKKRSNIALSTSDAEYVAATEACKEAESLRSLLREIIGQEICIDNYNDNQSAQARANEQVNCYRTKHIDVKCHFIREAIKP
ncbi:PREDICTED: uncharacterized protein LOC108553762 [Eufriesea mexicana]|uniref:uncharacterized protein LOC108553762 n=1 Tax=Eufriesea mexicana TaxID=516756 RepID=UPI00083C473E|nr:PREDICTED: uncharacterized protein LOC108553762 [Eufriesea mexicana]